MLFILRQHGRILLVVEYVFSLYHLTVGVKLLPPLVVSGGFVGQVKLRGGSKNCGFALGFTPPPWFQENLLDMSNRGGGEVI